LSVNGEAPQPYLLVERPDEEYLERTYGHRDFERLRAKRGTDAAEARGKAELLGMVRGGPDAGFAERAERRFDTAALLDVVTAALWCATGESFQSVLVRDRRGELASGRWFWVVWDFDMSFVGRPRYSRFGAARDYLPHALRPPRHALVNQVLLRRLLESDPAFRLALAERTTRALNHELTSAWFDGLIDGYERDARRLRVADLGYLERLRAFGRGRAEAVYAQLASHLGVGAPQPVEIVAPPGSVRVDGLSLAGSYRGRYPAGVSIRLDVEPAASARFAGWRADGRLLEGRPLRLALPVRGPLRIEARFDG
jgi:hypothetical protein